MIKHVAGYRFVPLTSLKSLREDLLNVCEKYQLKGTVLLSEEGININVAGGVNEVDAFKDDLQQDERFQSIRFHEALLEAIPYRRLKIKIKKEIITFSQPGLDVTTERAQTVSPRDFKRWFAEGREMLVLDTRNDFEVQCGTFEGALNLHIDRFTQLPEAVESLDRQQTIVMFCTGGIRCEKAALYMQQKGFDHVYQLDGGILGYFSEVGSDYYHGDCFVFDERIAVSSSNAKPCS